MDRKRIFRLSGICGLTALLVSGCQQDEIRSYKVRECPQVLFDLTEIERNVIQRIDLLRFGPKIRVRSEPV